MPIPEYHVFFEERKVGDLFEARGGSIDFQYDPEWITSGFEISHALPFREERYESEATIYFANLLPEGDVRAAVARKLGTALENDFSLLVALGGECAGALTIGKRPRRAESKYERVSLANLKSRFEHGETLLSSLQDIDGQIRFSLAGAQDKLAIFVKDNDIFIPRGNSPSTHILKPPSKRYPHVPDTECLTNWLARAMGLEVASTSIVFEGKWRACLIERYDRVTEKVGSKIRIHRLHQEDFCQALNFNHKVKYEKDGGPTFARSYKCVEDFSQHLPEDLERIVRWLIFNVVIGNCDGHAKNLSFLRTDDGDWKLSPHYDFIPTRIFPRVSKELAMSIGGSRDSGTIAGTHWKKLAGEIKFGSNLLLDLVREMAESAPDLYKSTASEFINLYGTSAVIQPIQKVIHEQSRRLLSEIKS